MSGHSKWAQIKHAKAATDKKKGQIYSKLVRQLTIAVREAGPDPSGNFKLRLVMEKARDAEMPKDNIDRAINKAAGGEGGLQLEQVTYEGYGPHGTAFLVEAVTDSKNRTTAQIRHLFELYGGSMGQPGSVAWNFESKGQILVSKTGGKLEDLEMTAIDLGAEDVRVSEEGLEIYTAPLDLNHIKSALEAAGAAVVSAEITMEAKSKIALAPEELTTVQKLFDALNDEEDVLAVYTSADL